MSITDPSTTWWANPIPIAQIPSARRIIHIRNFKRQFWTAVRWLSTTVYSVSVETYKAEAAEILDRYAADLISRKQCTDSLDDAALAAIPHLTPDQLVEFQNAFKANDDALRKKTTS